MKLIFLICAAAVCSSLLHAQGQTSQWPQRPAALEEARLLSHEGLYDEALKLLTPHLALEGVVGKEVRSLYTSLNMRRYMNREHPRASIYEVVSGDHLNRIAEKQATTTTMLMLMNGIVDPSRLRVGQKLVVLSLPLVIAIHEEQQELVLWDGDVMLASYPIVKTDGESLGDGAMLTVRQLHSYRGRSRVPKSSQLYQTGDKIVELDDGVFIAGNQVLGGAKTVYRLPQQQLNEWAIFATPLMNLSVQPASRKPGEKPVEIDSVSASRGDADEGS